MLRVTREVNLILVGNMTVMERSLVAWRRKCL